MRKQEYAWCNYSSVLFASVHVCDFEHCLYMHVHTCPRTKVYLFSLSTLALSAAFTWVRVQAERWCAQRVKTGEKWLFQKHQTELCRHKKHILRCVVLGQGYFSPARQPLFLLPSSFFELQLSLVIYCCAQFSCHKNETKCIESNADLQKVCSRRSQTATAVNISAQASKQPAAFWCNKAICNRKELIFLAAAQRVCLSEWWTISLGSHSIICACELHLFFWRLSRDRAPVAPMKKAPVKIDRARYSNSSFLNAQNKRDITKETLLDGATKTL